MYHEFLLWWNKNWKPRGKRGGDRIPPKKTTHKGCCIKVQHVKAYEQVGALFNRYTFELIKRFSSFELYIPSTHWREHYENFNRLL